MKHFFEFISLLFCLFPILASAQGTILPKEVNNCYKKRNFVIALSTSPERGASADHGSIEALPNHLSSSRLRKIFVEMRALQSRELTIDTRMGARDLPVSGISLLQKVYSISHKRMVVETLV